MQMPPTAPRFPWENYRGNLAWLPDHTFFLAKHGSHAYGTARPESDVDVKGVCALPGEYVHGFVNRFEQADKGWTDLDCCVFSVQKFFSLAADCNPNIVELPFVDESDWYAMPIRMVGLWRLVVDNRDAFLSKAAEHRFSGYAVAQLKRIQTHRRWLLHPPDHHPTRGEYGLPADGATIPKDQRDALEAMMLKVVESWQVDYAALDDANRIDLLNKQAAALADMKLSKDDQYVAAANKLGLDSNAIEYLKSERAYRAAMAEWSQYQTWLRERNPARAALEKLHGYDTKHAMHLVRLMRMAVEIAEGKGVLVRRPDAEELRAVRDGAWRFDDLMAWTEKMKAEVPAAYARSKLPRSADRNRLDGICMQIVEGML